MIILGGLGAAGLTAGGVGWLTSARGADPTTGPGATGEPLRQPPVLDSRDGRLEVTLTAAAGVFLAGRDTKALGYNGTSPGPTLRVRPGDELAITLVNRLDQPTNLHTHGLRVSPEGAGDNPFVRIDPGASHDYLIRVPSDHPAGTHWYHPHHHGTVAEQLFGGLVGALLVDRGPEPAVTSDVVMLITDTTLDGDGRPAQASAADKAQGRQGDLVLVNGQHQPTIHAAPGEVQRWRVVNACTSRVLPIRLAGHELVRIALDGTFLPEPAGHDTVLLAPGNRADVIVRPSATGRFEVSAEAFDRGGMGGMGGATTTGPVTLATLVTDGAAAPSAGLPTTPTAEVVPADEPTNRRRISLDMGMGGMGAGGMAVAIDGRVFDPERDDQTIALGATEEWTVTNSSPLAHPFHLHAWPFIVTATGDGSPVTGTPQDVVLIPARGWVRLRIPFTRYAGRSVYHCHILDHEDAGMMATINVRD